MAFTVKDWRDFPDTSTPLSAAAMEDTETRIKTEVESVTFRNYREYRPEDYGADPTGAGDSTTAFRDMMQDIEDSDIGGDILLQPGATYLVNGAPDHSKFGNAILPLPLKGGVLRDAYGVHSYPFPLQCLDVRFRSIGKATAIIKTTRTGDTYSGTWGAPSVIGGPTPEQLGGTLTQSTAGNIYIEGLSVVVPLNPEIAGVDLYHVQGVTIDSHAVFTAEFLEGDPDFVTTGPGDITVPTHKWAFGIRLPNGFNQGNVNAHDLTTQGTYCGMVLAGSHNVIFGGVAFCALGYGVMTGCGNGAETILPWVGLSDCVVGFAGWDETNGAYSLAGTETPIFDGFFITESAAGAPWTMTTLLLDANNRFTGSLKFFLWALGPSNTLPTITGGANFNFIRSWPGYLHSSRGVVITGPRSGGGFLEMDMGSVASGGIYVNDPGTTATLAQVFYTAGDTQPGFAIFAGPTLGAGYHVWGPGGATGGDTTLFRAAANQLKTDDTFIAADGVATKTKAGTPSDADFATTPPNGTMVVDTTAKKLWCRTGAAEWKWTALT